MNRRDFQCTLAGILASTPLLAAARPRNSVGSSSRADLERLVRDTVEPLMKEHGIPGMSVGVTMAGRRSHFHFGVASQESRRRVDERTIFEIGSISKTFTATLAGYAQARGALALPDPASKYLPALAGSAFDAISLLDLGTYTAGGLPLQPPDDIREGAAMVAWLRTFRPAYPPGTRRLYSNASMGLFGHLVARSLGQPFDALIEGRLLPALGLAGTYLHVPPAAMDDYAHGYARDGKPVRVRPGLWDSEAYGVKSTAADMLRYLELNMDPSSLDPALRSAFALTHTGFFRVDDLVQGLGWEMYALPTPLDRLLAGHSDAMTYQPHPVTRFAQPRPLSGDVLIDKTGSTNGFGAYAAFIPARSLGVVMLANRNYPNAARVTAAHRIMSRLQ